jgi:hypothetical protein
MPVTQGVTSLTASSLTLDTAIRREKVKSVARVASGNFLEMYDFMIYGYYAPAIGHAFFPKGSEFASLFQQISELLPVQGITLVGAIPDSVQRITTFSAGLSTTSRAQASARQLVAYLSSKHAWNTIRRSGLDPIVAPATARAVAR